MTVPDPKESTDNHGRLNAHIKAIESEAGEHGLLKALESLINNITGKRDNDKSAKRKKSSRKSNAGKYVPPSYSNQPTGPSWTQHALIQNFESIFGLTPTNTRAIREALGLPVSQQLVLVGGLIERLLSKHAPINDRNNTFESVVNILSGLSLEQKELVQVTAQPLLKIFHVCFSSALDCNSQKKRRIQNVGHNFRTADGSGNSVALPDVGKAGSNYTRTVTSRAPMNENLPSPEVIFDRLFKRPKDGFTPHKSGVNMLLLYLAILITHDLFYTDPKDMKRNLSTSYADLSPLYGFNRQNQESVRQMKNGLLKPDQFFDRRLVIQPPGVAALAVLFSRNHNYIAKTLLEKNENGRFSYGPGKALATAEEQDEELFQTARLINNGCYANIIVHDYLRTILGTTQDSDFEFSPLPAPEAPVYGNAVSVEFNLIYRWHAAIGQKDEQWINDVMSLLPADMVQHYKQQQKDDKESAHGGKSTTEHGVLDMIWEKFNEKFVHASPEELALGLPIAGGHRDLQTGLFSDHKLTLMLRRGYTQIASELGNGLKIPEVLRPVEIAGINQARALRCCYFNEFRRFFNLTELTTFEDFSEIKSVQETLKELYGTPDKVELYVGLIVERTKQTGLRLPYTIGRSILSDATNLLRNDRILTEELTPSNLTNWGFLYQQGDPQRHNRVLPTMIKTLLPNANSGHKPAFTEEELTNLFYVPSTTASSSSNSL
ncbi:heme peroxidase [Radiomyces spectabilis]|uniref:heme peroxidase n=1 Tax=Radiomyces spectabilis TaxID=64574 RepID=UPI00221F6A6A|nr:heme peroxidase [Radiomyces spectabilis]KAI8376096.1 heme peroxidase [Radiomyces spectabilis]